MSKTNFKAFQHVLQDSIQLEDEEWSYQVPNLPRPSTINPQHLIKSIVFLANSKSQHVLLKLQEISLNRGIIGDPLDCFVLISLADFRPRIPQPTTNGSNVSPDTRPATARDCADYVVKVLRSGITLNGTHYNFYGHSNSQLKSRTCFLYAAPLPEVSKKVEALGDFTKMKTVAKKSKRIGLLFSVAQMAITLEPSRCQDIPDIEVNDYIFTDGCGLISPHLAHKLVQKAGIGFRNVRYTPSVFQIRYRGYKGVLMLDPAMKGEILVKFRKSMKKFTGGADLSFSVVECSKPYGFGYLNDEVVLLLHALGIPETALLRKQAEHFQFLSEATHEPRVAFRFLTYTNNLELAEKLLMESIESVQPTIKRLVNAEYDRMLNKRDEQRCRILIPKSRLLFGVCDAWGVLKEGECAVKVTMDGDGQPRAITGTEVLVTRNPCLHPGDLQKFKAVVKPELEHLVDCIVFPTRGRRPAADLMSGGDLDGDTFFVCWDSDLIPDKLSEPAQYPGAKEPVVFKAISDDDRLVYFARYTNASLGRVKNLFLDWARLKGPMSAECQQLNRLFSMCVDGNRIKVPRKLESPPLPTAITAPFILDTLHDAAKAIIQAQAGSEDYEGYNFDAMELLLSRDDIAMSEFELVNLTHRWCRRNNGALSDFLHLFDFNLLTAEEKAWTLNQLPASVDTPSLIQNALFRSNLLQASELQPFKLNHPGLRWKCVFDSSQDRLATFLDTVARTVEIFHRKLIVVQVDERLTLAIYVPQKIGRGQEGQVDNRVRLFAFPHSRADETSHRLAVPTKMNYRLYCDGNVFQLFETMRRNSWIYIARGASDDSGYRNIDGKADKRKARQLTIDNGLNYDCIASIALDKFSRGLQKYVGRVNRNGLLAAEVYFISNRDVKSMQNLDLWLDFVDTREIIPLFEKNAREYVIQKLTDVDWSVEPEHLEQIAKESRFSEFKALESKKEYTHIFGWLLEKSEMALLLQIYKYLLEQLKEGNGFSAKTPIIIQAMVDFLEDAPLLSSTFARIDSLEAHFPDDPECLAKLAAKILHAHILCANEMQEFVVEPFTKMLSQIQSMNLTDFAGLVKLISLTVRSPEIGLDLLLECLEPASCRILSGSPELKDHFVRNLMGIALDHIDEASQSHPSRQDLLELKIDSRDSVGYALVQSQLRIDAPSDTMAVSDHVRLTVASSPANSVTKKKYSMDALVETYEPGLARFRCFHPLPPFSEQCSWEIQNCGSFVTTKAMFDAVLTLATQSQECCDVWEQILGIPQGPRDGHDLLPAKYPAMESLNPSQNAAVHVSLSYPLTCLWGPPGTGKTHTIVEIIKRLQSGNRRILVTAPTHNAVDNVMRKYLSGISAASILDGGGPIPIRVSTDVRKVADDLKKFTCDAMAGKELHGNYSAMNKARDRIKKCRLIFTTCIGSGLGLLRSESFDTVIIDEASQQTEPASLVPLAKGCKKAILVGDHVQLRATVQQHAVLSQFEISLFERLYLQPNSAPNSNDIAKVMLDTQYRMHSSICAFPSAEFYENKLQTGISDNSRPLPPSDFPWSTPPSKDHARMIFVECNTPEVLGHKSKSNKGQAQLCYEICTLLNAPPDPTPNATATVANANKDSSVTTSPAVAQTLKATKPSTTTTPKGKQNPVPKISKRAPKPAIAERPRSSAKSDNILKATNPVAIPGLKTSETSKAFPENSHSSTRKASAQPTSSMPQPTSPSTVHPLPTPTPDSPASRKQENPPSIAVLTPYAHQTLLLKPLLSSFPNVEISSIDGFQGREADIVIFVTVRCNVHYEIGFLKDLRRMNVALTRARKAVIIVGNKATLKMGKADEESTAVWRRLLGSCVEVKIGA